MSERKIVPLAIAATLLIGLSACAPAPALTTSSQSPDSDTTQTEGALPLAAPDSAPSVEDIARMTDVEIAWEALMGLDGEYAAAASYQAVLDEYGQVEPYATILEAENRHIDALIRQLENFGVTVPSNPYLGTIAAPGDLATAAEAWAEGEVLNVEMYDELLKSAEGSNLIKVLTNLRRASLESHLPSFELAAANGGTLTADQMSMH